jgi:hypothetical protein
MREAGTMTRVGFPRLIFLPALAAIACGVLRRMTAIIWMVYTPVLGERGHEISETSRLAQSHIVCQNTASLLSVSFLLHHPGHAGFLMVQQLDSQTSQSPVVRTILS